MVKELAEMDVDLEDAGFRIDEVEKMLGDIVTEDNPLDKSSIQHLAELGDIWTLGEHRVICGDSTDAGTVERLCADEMPNLMVTDPPYGVEYEPEWRNELLEGDRRNTAQVENDDEWDWTPTYKLFQGNVAYVWHGGKQSGHVQLSLESASFIVRGQIIWMKIQPIISRGHYRSQHESCYYAVRKGATASWNGSRTESTVWQTDIDRDDKTIHSTQKPIKCMAIPIKNHTKKGEAVYDPFLGSGTTLIAADQLERRCFGVEINPDFVDIIIARYQVNGGTEIMVERNGETKPIEALV